MGSNNGKIFYIIKRTLFIFFLFTIINIYAGQENSASKLRAEKIIVPIYQEGKTIPAIILYGDEARPIGTRFEMKGVRLIWIGDSIKDIKGTIKTPEAVYNQTTKMIAGNNVITYRSNEIDIDGIGFDIDQEKQTIHIRSEVKVTLKGDLSSKKQIRESKKIKNDLPLSSNSDSNEPLKANKKLKKLLNQMRVNKKGIK